MNADFPRLRRNRLTRAGKIIHLSAVHLQRGIDGCRLHLPAKKLRQDVKQLLPLHARAIARKNPSAGVLRIGLGAKSRLKIIFLVLVDKNIKQTRRAAEADGQYARRRWIQRAKMPGPLLRKNLAHVVYRITGRHARRFQDGHNPVHINRQTRPEALLPRPESARMRSQPKLPACSPPRVCARRRQTAWRSCSHPRWTSRAD
ncbi:hypothetical protein SDC9_120689 [bioreactor metagenome]|uniref:Uncharacterized protein n=1 Tax=bioreactor metagenome TaxID=1076179 RepID=A0A645C9V8_9ZZZZ